MNRKHKDIRFFNFRKDSRLAMVLSSEDQLPRIFFGVPRMLGVLSHHLKCEMKSPHLVDFRRHFVDVLSNLGRMLANF